MSLRIWIWASYYSYTVKFLGEMKWIQSSVQKKDLDLGIILNTYQANKPTVKAFQIKLVYFYLEIVVLLCWDMLSGSDDDCLEP